MVAWLAGVPVAAAARAPRAVTPPPRVLNVVRQKLKPGTARAYENLETAIVKAYAQAHVDIYWTMLQSRTDATDVVYLNTADSLEEWEQLHERYRRAAAAHPELDRMSARLSTFIARSSSTLTTRRDELAVSRSGVDLQTMRALSLAVFRV